MIQACVASIPHLGLMAAYVDAWPILINPSYKLGQASTDPWERQAHLYTDPSSQFLPSLDTVFNSITTTIASRILRCSPFLQILFS